MTNKLLRETDWVVGTVPNPLPQHRRDGEYVVTGDENPLPTGGYVMSPSGMWLPQAGTEEGVLKTEVTGSNILVQTVFSRSVRSGTQNTIMSVPNGAKGFIVMTRAYGITGTFSSGQGLNLLVDQRNFLNDTLPMWRIETTKQNAMFADHLVTVYPGINTGDSSMVGSRVRKTSALVVSGNINFRLDITGEFEPEQGFDVECVIHWLF